MKTSLLTLAALMAICATAPHTGAAADFVVYSVYKSLDLGNPGEATRKDYYVNMGAAQGLRQGSQLEVLRKTASYDLLNEKLYQDVVFPIARIKVIHVENNAAICRLEKFMPLDKTPVTAAQAVMVGDLVRQVQ